eukprot:scaffold6116_cov104-Isochrysis_galbana.AAC.1
MFMGMGGEIFPTSSHIWPRGGRPPPRASGQDPSDARMRGASMQHSKPPPSSPSVDATIPPAIPELCPRPRSARHCCTRPGFGCVGEGVPVGEAARGIHERSNGNGSRVSQPGMHPGVIACFRNGMLAATPHPAGLLPPWLSGCGRRSRRSQV